MAGVMCDNAKNTFHNMPYSCINCGKRFRLIETLELHTLRHTEEDTSVQIEQLEKLDCQTTQDAQDPSVIKRTRKPDADAGEKPLTSLNISCIDLEPSPPPAIASPSKCSSEK